MHIAILNITGGSLSGGYAKYLDEIVPRLSADSRVKRVDLFLPSEASVQRASFPEARTLSPADARVGFRELRRELARTRPDVVFIPTARWLDCGQIPVVSMVRNMEPLTIPLSPRHPVEIARNLVRRRVAYRSCVRSDGVIAVSQFVSDFVTEKWRIPAERVSVIHHGVDHAQRAGDESFRPDNFPPQARFVFTAGSIRPARGLEDVITALGRLKSEGEPVHLAIAGAIDRGMGRYRNHLQDLAIRTDCVDRVHWLGALDASAMRWFYRHCAAFVMTSRAEACPNVALEAMAHGCNCVSTDQPPMPEMFAETAAYYRAGDGGSLARALEARLSLGSEALAETRKAATLRARIFSWDCAASRTVDFLAGRSA